MLALKTNGSYRDDLTPDLLIEIPNFNHYATKYYARNVSTHAEKHTLLTIVDQTTHITCIVRKLRNKPPPQRKNWCHGLLSPTMASVCNGGREENSEQIILKIGKRNEGGRGGEGRNENWGIRTGGKASKQQTFAPFVVFSIFPSKESKLIEIQNMNKPEFFLSIRQ